MSKINDPKVIKREHREWEKTVDLFYDVILEHKLTWPTLTCQWLPHSQENTQELLIGTHTNDEEENFVEFLQVQVPENELDTKGNSNKFNITQKITHPGEVNRARYQPHQPNRIATKTREGDVLVFDRTNHTNPILKLKGHQKEGYGLAWNPHQSKQHHILSASFDHTVCHWDTSMTPNNDRELQPYQRYEAHTDCVEDVSWNSANDSIFASVGDDKRLIIWDSRDPVKPVKTLIAHKGEINSVAFHPNQNWLIATGSSDKYVGLFDIRKMNRELGYMKSHDGGVTQVAWSPHDDPILASAGEDRGIIIWDLRNIGLEQDDDDAEEGPPEFKFLHNGHTGQITDFSWNPKERWVIASVTDDNIVHVWKMCKHMYTDREIDSSQLE